MSPVYAFLDTNIVLHFRPPDEIDWPALFGTAEVVIVIAPVVYRQLDRHKDDQNKRAKVFVSKMRSILGRNREGPLRTGVILRFLHNDPIVEFSALGLSREVEDDQLIASMIQFQQATPAASVTLVTDDFLLGQKALARHFEWIAPPDHQRLADEPSADERHHEGTKGTKTTASDDQRFARITYPTPGYSARPFECQM